MNYNEKIVAEGLTFDDVLLIPRYSEITPDMAVLKTRLTKHIDINTPLMSAAMDTVTEHQMAIQMALHGGVGVVHKNMKIEDQAEEIAKVKAILIDDAQYPLANKDKQGRLLVGASIGITADKEIRVKAVLDAGADFLVLDSAHGHSKNVVSALKSLKAAFPQAEIIAGNVATYEGAKCLMEAGADAVKVGMGPGSICTTRVISGMGVPQITAVMEAEKAKQEYDCPIIADGGIQHSGDIVKAIAAGADTVMLGAIFGACEEAPGGIVVVGKKVLKSYRGMGSIGAMEKAHGSADRYFQTGHQKLVPEGVEALVPCSGKVGDVIFTLLGGLRSGMGYEGCRDIPSLQKEAMFMKITSASLKESHPHDVTISREAPNYKCQ
ncbi:MAG: IMP dehydrogenase [Bacilli bacterium]|nr:IMP dehydrogenase [Bacilli bacterium]